MIGTELTDTPPHPELTAQNEGGAAITLFPIPFMTRPAAFMRHLCVCRSMLSTYARKLRGPGGRCETSGRRSCWWPVVQNSSPRTFSVASLTRSFTAAVPASVPKRAEMAARTAACTVAGGEQLLHHLKALAAHGGKSMRVGPNFFTQLDLKCTLDPCEVM